MVVLRLNDILPFPVEAVPTKKIVAQNALKTSWMKFAGLEVSFGEEVGDGQSALAALAHHLLSQVCTKGLGG